MSTRAAGASRSRPRAPRPSTPRRAEETSLGPTARKIRSGDRRVLARLISETESGEASARETLRELYQFTGTAPVVGITGPLGVGKSSLINRLIHLLRAQGKRVGIIAVDPSSPFSGGAVLGDRIRIERDAADQGVFFRSMASRGHAGGLSQTTRDAVRLLEAFGMEVVLVETVGSGQVDVEVHNVATTRIVVVVPHLGDEVQTMKAGLFEIADVFVVNKSDLPGSDRAAKDLNELASLSVPRDGWRPRVVQTSAAEDRGTSDLWKAVEEHERSVRSGPGAEARRRESIDHEVRTLLQERLLRQLDERVASDPAWRRAVADVVSGASDPYSAAERSFEELRRRL